MRFEIVINLKSRKRTREQIAVAIFMKETRRFNITPVQYTE